MNGMKATIVLDQKPKWCVATNSRMPVKLTQSSVNHDHPYIFTNGIDCFVLTVISFETFVKNHR